MKDIIPKDSRYVPFVQQRWCCVPACLSMIMYKHGFPLRSQEELGYHLGLIVAPESRKLFWVSRKGQKPMSGYGTQIGIKRFDINAVFSKLNIPLHMTFHSARSFTPDSLLAFLNENEKDDTDVLVCFDVGAIEESKDHGGHVCVFDRVDKRRIRVIDPSQNQPKWRFVDIAKLHRGMAYHWNKSGGVWKFELKK